MSRQGWTPAHAATPPVVFALALIGVLVLPFDATTRLDVQVTPAAPDVEVRLSKPARQLDRVETTDANGTAHLTLSKGLYRVCAATTCTDVTVRSNVGRMVVVVSIAGPPSIFVPQRERDR